MASTTPPPTLQAQPNGDQAWMSLYSGSLRGMRRMREMLGSEGVKRAPAASSEGDDDDDDDDPDMPPLEAVTPRSVGESITKDAIVHLGKSMMAPEHPLPIYKVSDPGYAFTLLTIQGKHISYEGVPCVGKTTLMHSTRDALAGKQVEVDAHEEDADREMLHEFFKDPKRYAFWFQMFKLRGRQQRALMHEYELRSGNRQQVTYLEDRDMPGDMAFALYNYLKGNISEEQIRIYMKEATKINFHQPFLTLYLTAPPTRLRENVVTRGNPDEIAFYTEDYFVDMDVCYRAALEICGCTYCVVEWGENIPGVGAPGPWGPHHGRVPPEKCFEVIEAGIAAAYGRNIARIHELHGELHDSNRIVLSPGSGRSLRGSDPAQLVQEVDTMLRVARTKTPPNESAPQ
jgi:deoxyadenosine/deoxycytidine kinase